jgi:signal transduction histidine kinase
VTPAARARDRPLPIRAGGADERREHAGAARSSVVVGRRDGVTAGVEDAGQGFAPDDVRQDARGLLAMRERLALVGGTLAVESAPGKGTALIAFVPR